MAMTPGNAIKARIAWANMRLSLKYTTLMSYKKPDLSYIPDKIHVINWTKYKLKGHDVQTKTSPFVSEKGLIKAG